jgi:hypothetical protein
MFCCCLFVFYVLLCLFFCGQRVYSQVLQDKGLFGNGRFPSLTEEGLGGPSPTAIVEISVWVPTKKPTCMRQGIHAFFLFSPSCSIETASALWTKQAYYEIRVCKGDRLCTCIAYDERREKTKELIDSFFSIFKSLSVFVFCVLQLFFLIFIL